MIQKKIVVCHKCKRQTSFYRKFRNESGDWVYECLSHPKKEQLKDNAASKKVYDDFCRKLWKKRKHVSELSGKNLPEYNEHSPRFCNLIRFHMHHVKPIGMESKSKKELDIVFDESKIIFVTYDEHNTIEYGNPESKDRIGWTQWQKNNLK